METHRQPIKHRKHRRSGYGPVAALLVTIGTYFAAHAVVIVMVSVIPLITGWSVSRLQTWLDESVFARFIIILAVEVITLWLIWLFLQARKVALKTIGLVKPQLRDVGYVLLGYAAYSALFFLMTAVAVEYIPGLDLEQRQEIGFSTQITGAGLIFVFMSLVVLPPIAEEIITRGFLYTGLKSKLPKVAAAIITSVIFAAAHLQGGTGNALLWVAAVDTFILSMILVYLREKTGSLWSPMIVHGLKNCVAFVLLFIVKA